MWWRHRLSLETAQLNLGYTKVFAPVDGYLTNNINTSPGTYVNAGEQLLALRGREFIPGGGVF